MLKSLVLNPGLTIIAYYDTSIISAMSHEVNSKIWRAIGVLTDE